MSYTINPGLQIIFAIVMIIFMMWIAPQAVGFKPFLMDLYDLEKKSKEKQRKENI